MRIILLTYCLLSFSDIIFSQTPKLILPLNHRMPLSQFVVSPNKKFFATCSMDYSVKLWDVSSGSLIDNLSLNSNINAIDYAFDNKKILIATDDSILIWNTYTDRIDKKFKATSKDKMKVKFIKFSPNGNTFITYANSSFTFLSSSELRVWNTESGKLEKEFKNEVNEVIIENPNGSKEKGWSSGSTFSSAKFSPDGKQILITYSGNKIILYMYPSFKKVRAFTGSKCDLSYDGKYVIINDFEKIEVWHTEALNIEPRELPVNKSEDISDVLFNHSGEKAICIANGFMRLYNMQNNSYKDLYGNANKIYSAQFSSDDKYLLSLGSNNIIDIWDCSNGSLINSIKAEQELYTIAVFTPDNKKILAPALSGSLHMWNIKTGKEIDYAKAYTPFLLRLINFFPESNMFLTGSNGDYLGKLWNSVNFSFLGNLKADNSYGGNRILMAVNNPINNTIIIYQHKSLEVYDEATKKYIGSFNMQSLRSDEAILLKYEHLDSSIYVGFKDGSLLIIDANNYSIKKVVVTPTKNTKVMALNRVSSLLLFTVEDTVVVFDFNGNKILYKLRVPGTRYYVNEESKLDKVLVLDSEYDETPSLWNIEKKIKLFSIKGHNDDISCVKFSHDGKKLLIGSKDQTCSVWNIATGSLIFKLAEHNSGISDVHFSADDRFIYTCSYDRTIKIWSSINGVMIAEFCAFDNDGSFLLLKNGYYQTSLNAAKFLHFNKNLKVISFEQLDVKYNRPDKVLEAIGNTDTALIKSYRKAWEKRIKKLGIDTTQFRDGYSVPEADFVNRDGIDYEQENGKLRLHIRGIDSTYKLDRFNVWVNESPLFGQRGIRMRKKNSNILDTTITIILSQGENRIETSITNVNGTESYRVPLYVNYTPVVKQKEMTRFIGIGIDRFKESNYNLQYSTKDIRDLALKLKEKYKDNIIIDTLFNENVTTANVKALKQKLQETTVNDKVIISYSGHGMLSKEYDYYLSTYSVNFSQPGENGLPYDELENLLDSIPARKKLLLIDACHSGEVDKEEQLVMDKKALDLGLGKGADPESNNNNLYLGLKNSFELMQSLFVNVGKSTGATVIAAAAGNQYALEGVDKQPNGIFTYCLLEALNKNETITINELKKQVGLRVEELTKGLQRPTSRKENNTTDWSVW